MMDNTAEGGLSNVRMVLYGISLVGGGIAIGYFLRHKLAYRTPRCNHRIKLSAEKIVDSFDVEDFDSKKVFCRCWHSEKFPYCDGSHVAHNKRTGDNVGPLIINSQQKDRKTRLKTSCVLLFEIVIVVVYK